MVTRRDVLRLALLGPVGARVLPSRAGAAPALPPRLPADVGEDESYWNSLRWHFAFPEEETYCQTATLGASPKVVTEATIAHLRWVEEGLPKWDYTPEQPNRMGGYSPERDLRDRLGAFLGCEGSEVALTPNATVGMNFVANGIDLEAGDEVVTTNMEHPGGRKGWDLKGKRLGIQVREVEIPVPPNDPDEIVRRWEAATNSRTKVWAIPHVTSALGLVMPVKRLCASARARGIFTAVDGAQAVGHLAVNLRDLGCDAYFSSPHKWLLAPKGNGILYVRREAQERIWTTLASSEWENAKEGLYRLMQWGTVNASLVRGFEVALDFFDRIGMPRIERRIRYLGDRLRAGLREIPRVAISSSVHPDLACGITTWKIEGISPRALMDEMWRRRRIRIRSVSDVWGARTSTHVYVSPAQVDSLLEVARELAKA
ncbi:MAG TPA: aminotransferase class V-fold PLP-dependent enzyme [Planctomycetota bacterium]|jgi:selenocysteine lyase/cysteine desulfurase|nr:aminotransferase class V-fold PLP-dependent enzyme [Planctomycetota bacterium]